VPYPSGTASHLSLTDLSNILISNINQIKRLLVTSFTLHVANTPRAKTITKASVVVALRFCATTSPQWRHSAPQPLSNDHGRHARFFLQLRQGERRERFQVDGSHAASSQRFPSAIRLQLRRRSSKTWATAKVSLQQHSQSESIRPSEREKHAIEGFRFYLQNPRRGPTQSQAKPTSWSGGSLDARVGARPSRGWRLRRRVYRSFWSSLHLSQHFHQVQSVDALGFSLHSLHGLHFRRRRWQHLLEQQEQNPTSRIPSTTERGRRGTLFARRRKSSRHRANHGRSSPRSSRRWRCLQFSLT